MIYCWTRGTLWELFFSPPILPFQHPSPQKWLQYDSLSLIVGTKQQALSASFILSTGLLLVASVFKPLAWELGFLSVEKLAVHNLKTSPLITCDIHFQDPVVLRKNWQLFLVDGMVEWGSIAHPPGDLSRLSCGGCPCARDLASLPPSSPVPCTGDSQGSELICQQ